MFSTYQWLKPPDPSTAFPSSEYYRGVFLAGFACGIPLTLLQNPLDVWRTRLQTSYIRGSSAVLQSILSSANPQAALMRGTSITFARNTLGNGIYFSCYEWTTRIFDAQFSAGDGEKSWQHNFARAIACGGSTGVAFNALFHPLMTVRARMQAATASSLESRGGPSDVARSLFRAAGIGGFYRGVSIVLVRSFPVNAAGFGAMELTKTLFALEQ